MAIQLRKVFKKDWDFILSLRNQFYDSFYQQNKPIAKKDHYLYLTKQISNPNFHHWIIEQRNKKIGYVRIKGEDVGIMVNKDFQYHGVGTETLKLVEKEAKKIGITKLIALVKITNKESKKIFLKNNYELKMNWYEKKI